MALWFPPVNTGNSTELTTLISMDRMIFPDEVPFPKELWTDPAVQSHFVQDLGSRVGYITAELDVHPAARESDDSIPCKGAVFIISGGILKPFQGRGYATTMMKWCVSDAPFLSGRTHLVSTVRKSNKAALAMNRRAGFEPAKTLPGYYENGEDALMLSRLI